MADDREISQRYRELPREEPPRHLDEAILAAARRAAETRPAPLVVPTGRRRWYFPLAAAAVIVLAVAVTMHVERQQPDVEIAEAPVAASPPPAPLAREEQAAPAQAPAKRESFTPDPKPAPSRSEPRPRLPIRENSARSATLSRRLIFRRPRKRPRKRRLFRRLHLPRPRQNRLRMP